MRNSKGEEQIKLVPSLEQSSKRLKDAIGGENLIFITGPPGVGKTTLVMKLFQEKREYLNAYINCYEISTPTQLYSTIYQAFLAGLSPSAKECTTKLPKGKIDDLKIKASDFPDYLEEFNRIAAIRKIAKLYVTLDQVELFRRTPLIDCVTLLSTIEKFYIIMISNEAPLDIVHCFGSSHENMMSVQDMMVPISVPHWSRDDLIHAITEYPPTIGQDTYKKFVNNVVQSSSATGVRSFHEIKMFCQKHYPKVLADFERLRKEKLVSCLRKERQFRDASEEEITKYISESGAVVSNQMSNSCFILSSSNALRARDTQFSDSDIRIPTNSAYLIVAAFIASLTRPVDDKRNFVKLQTKKAKQVTRSSKQNVYKMFTLERLLHIYCRLLEINLDVQKTDFQSRIKSKVHHVYNNDHVLSDVERLENLNLIQLCAGDGISPETRYKLSQTVKREYVERLAKRQEIDFDQIQGLS